MYLVKWRSNETWFRDTANWLKKEKVSNRRKESLYSEERANLRKKSILKSREVENGSNSFDVDLVEEEVHDFDPNLSLFLRRERDKERNRCTEILWEAYQD